MDENRSNCLLQFVALFTPSLVHTTFLQNWLEQYYLKSLFSNKKISIHCLIISFEFCKYIVIFATELVAWECYCFHGFHKYLSRGKVKKVIDLKYEVIEIKQYICFLFNHFNLFLIFISCHSRCQKKQGNWKRRFPM
jgi:hypothetical protein